SACMDPAKAPASQAEGLARSERSLWPTVKKLATYIGRRIHWRRCVKRPWGGKIAFRAATASAAAALGVAASAAAQAADAPPLASPQAEASSGWIATVGGTAVLGPRYAGAEKYGLSGLPSLSFRRAGTPLEFSAPDDGLDYTLYGTPTFKVGPVAN